MKRLPSRNGKADRASERAEHAFHGWVQFLTLDNSVAKGLRHPLVGILLLPLAGLYVALYKPFSELTFVKENLAFFLTIFILSAVITVGVTAYRALGDLYSNPNDRTVYTLSHLIFYVERIVEAKLIRCRNSLEKLLPNRDPYEEIIKPEDQLAAIVQFFVAFIHEIAELKDKELRIEVMVREPGSRRWRTVACCSGPRRTVTKHFEDASSPYKFAVDRERPLFFADKSQLDDPSIPDDVKLVLCDEDRANNVGSLYLYPMSFGTREEEEEGSSDSSEQDETENDDKINAEKINECAGLLKVVTHGKQLCERSNKADEENFRTLFNAFARRVEIELCHLALLKARSQNLGLQPSLRSSGPSASPVKSPPASSASADDTLSLADGQAETLVANPEKIDAVPSRNERRDPEHRGAFLPNKVARGNRHAEEAEEEKS